MLGIVDYIHRVLIIELNKLFSNIKNYVLLAEISFLQCNQLTVEILLKTCNVPFLLTYVQRITLCVYYSITIVSRT